jgi:SNF2 family DNA or RNA helicase
MIDGDPAIKTPQLAHQRQEYLESREKTARAIFWEMGLGKSKLIIDVASHLHKTNKIDALVVIAPNATYPNWIRIECPKHMAADYVHLIYPKTDSQRDTLHRMIFTDPTEFQGKLRVVTIGFDALAMTDRAYDFLERFVRIHRTMLVVDESTAIKNRKTKTSIRVKKLGRLAHRRWILTGTPAANSPFDLHSQIEFLNPEFWGWHGLKSYAAFKSEFGVWKTRRMGARMFPELEEYRGLDKLHDIISEIASRLTKEDSGVELPPKMYELKTFDMVPAQKKLYEQVRKRLWAELEGGLEVDARLAVTRLIRLHQIASGFVTADDTVDVPAGVEEMPDLRLLLKNRVLADIIPPEENPRLDLLRELISQTTGKVIIWARFTREIDQICDMLGEDALRYDGQVNDRSRTWALERFCDPTDTKHRFLVANVKSISHGVTLIVAKTMIYYSNDYSPEKRLQSEDRFHRIGQDQPVLIVDMAAYGTVDIKLLEGLLEKFETSALVTGDKYREWISLPMEEAA